MRHFGRLTLSEFPSGPLREKKVDGLIMLDLVNFEANKNIKMRLLQLMEFLNLSLFFLQQFFVRNKQDIN